jgi:hypothetical protein
MFVPDVLFAGFSQGYVEVSRSRAFREVSLSSEACLILHNL